MIFEDLSVNLYHLSLIYTVLSNENRKCIYDSKERKSKISVLYILLSEISFQPNCLTTNEIEPRLFSLEFGFAEFNSQFLHGSIKGISSLKSNLM